jgi:DNA-binding transcriptional MerR regulator
MNLETQSYLTDAERQTILRGLAEGMRPAEVRDLLEAEHGRKVNLTTVTHYRDSEKWAEAIAAERERMQAELATLPLSQAYVRQTMRAELIEKHRDAAGALGGVRGLLLDAAKEAGDMRDDAGSSAVQLTVHLVQQVLNLPGPALRAYVESGELDPTAYLPDVLAARKLADIDLVPVEQLPLAHVPPAVMASVRLDGAGSGEGLR